MEERTSPVRSAPPNSVALPEATGARWDRTDGAAAAVVRVKATLVAAEPLCIGGAHEDDPEDISDLPLLTDPLTGRPLLPGTTLAGALRAYLDAREHGFPTDVPKEMRERRERIQQKGSLAATLFGGLDVEQDPSPSAIDVDDALGHLPRRTPDSNRPPEEVPVEVYEGNRLAGATRTAEENALFSRTAWPAGTTFDLHFELELPVDQDRAARCATALVSALRGLEGDGEPGGDRRAGIRLGARKRRGFGRVRVDPESWRVRCFDLSDPDDFLFWVHEGDEPLKNIESKSFEDVVDLAAVFGEVVGEEIDIVPDARHMFFVTSECALPYGILDRTAGTTDEPDVAHRCAYDPEEKKERPVLTGTQQGGALRARASRIAESLATDEDTATDLVERIFGSDPDQDEDDLRAGRLWIDRCFIDGDGDPVGLMDLVQNRIRLDPWTQAPVHSALFNERPVRGGLDVQVRLCWRLDHPEDSEVGLLIHLLKDLWSEDLAVAGTQSIGRGLVCGRTAAFEARKTATELQRWEFETREPNRSQTEMSLRFTEGAPGDLNRYSDALWDHFSSSTE